MDQSARLELAALQLDPKSIQYPFKKAKSVYRAAILSGTRTEKPLVLTQRPIRDCDEIVLIEGLSSLWSYRCVQV